MFCPNPFEGPRIPILSTILATKSLTRLAIVDVQHPAGHMEPLGRNVLGQLLQNPRISLGIERVGAVGGGVGDGLLRSVLPVGIVVQGQLQREQVELSPER